MYTRERAHTHTYAFVSLLPLASDGEETHIFVPATASLPSRGFIVLRRKHVTIEANLKLFFETLKVPSILLSLPSYRTNIIKYKKADRKFDFIG
jgi:hypothetical protein